MQVAQVAHDGLSLAAAMASDGNPNSVTDAGVGAMCLRTAVLGAVLNARINCGDLEDADYVELPSAALSALERELAGLGPLRAGPALGFVRDGGEAWILDQLVEEPQAAEQLGLHGAGANSTKSGGTSGHKLCSMIE